MVLRGEIMKCSCLQNKVNKIVSCKTRNQQQTSQITDKPVKPPTNQSNHPQTTQKPVKPPTNQPNIGQTTQKPIVIKVYVTKNFKNNAKHVLILQQFYSISSTFSSEDQSHVGIEGKWREIIKRVAK